MSAQPALAIGQRIREERMKRGINLRSLARSVNVSASHISQIETGKCQPSVSTLYAITVAIGVSVDELFEVVADTQQAGRPSVAPAREAVTPIPAASQKVTAGTSDLAHLPHVAAKETSDPVAALAAFPRSSRQLGAVVRPSERDTLQLDSGVTWERLGHVPGQSVDFLLITYEPGSSSSSTNGLMRHSGTEFGYLISGELIVTVGFSEYRMTPDDSICFPSTTPHRYRNDCSEAAIGIWFVVSSEEA